MIINSSSNQYFEERKSSFLCPVWTKKSLFCMESSYKDHFLIISSFPYKIAINSEAELFTNATKLEFIPTFKKNSNGHGSFDSLLTRGMGSMKPIRQIKGFRDVSAKALVTTAKP